MQRCNHVKLDQLMNGFHITGRHLAGLMNVDYSLISKWRNGKRSIAHMHIQKIAEIFIALDKPIRFTRLTQITGYQTYNPAQTDEASMRIYLEAWLQAEEIETPADDLRRLVSGRARASEIYVFYGVEGKREAVDIFLDYALEDTSQNIWLLSQEDPDWLTDDHEYLQNWQKKNERIIEQNNTIQVIHPVSKNYKQVADYIIRWAPILMRQNARAYYIPKYQDPQCQVAVFLNENKAALISMFVQDQTRKQLTYLISDRDILKNIKDVLLDQFRASRELFSPMAYADPLAFRHCISACMKSLEPMACMVGEPPVFLIQEGIWKTCIDHSAMQEEEREQCYTLARKHCYENIKREAPQTDVYCAFHMPSIERMLTQDQIVLAALSRLAGFPVTVSRVDYCRLLLSALDIIRMDSHVHAVLVEKTPFTPHTIDVYAWRKGAACLLDTENMADGRGASLSVQEATVSLAMYYRCMALIQSALNEQAPTPVLEQWIQSAVDKAMKR